MHLYYVCVYWTGEEPPKLGQHKTNYVAPAPKHIGANKIGQHRYQLNIDSQAGLIFDCRTIGHTAVPVALSRGLVLQYINRVIVFSDE